MPEPVGPAVPPHPDSGRASGVSPGVPSSEESPGRSIIDAAADLIRLFVEYVRQETDALVKDKVVYPTQQAGQVVAFALAAAMVLFLGIAYVSVGALILLAQGVGWPGALFIVGGVLLVGAGVLTALKIRRIQK